MKSLRQIEKEFGVPIPGVILEREKWTQTAWKRLPETGLISWPDIFGRQAALVLDLGCGNGRFLLGSALRRPEVDHVGIDVLPMVLRYATRRANQRGLGNVRFAACDARAFLGKYVAPLSLAEIHCYHPQPYHDPRQASKRLLTPAFLELVHRSLVPAGLFFVQTDNAAYWDYLKKVVPAFFEFTALAGPWPETSRGRTRREIIAMRQGLAVFRGWGKARQLSAAELGVLSSSLPAPLFDAGPATRNLDRLEQGL